MTAFGPERANDVLAQCQSASDAIGQAFSRAFGGEFLVRPNAPTQLASDDQPADLAGSGILFELVVGGTPCLAALPQSEGLLPDWCAEPDHAAQEKLNELGTDLCAAMLPPGVDHTLVRVVAQTDLAIALAEAKPRNGALCLPLELVQGEAITKLLLIWPVATFDDATGTVAEEGTAARGNAPTTASAKLPKHRRLIYRNLEEGIRQLPPYAQSLLRVRVPVTVTLAAAKTPVSKILDMGPGTILQFKKACDSNLTLEVGRQTVAEGEAVKVGDKFGLWITSMTMPGERFWSVNKSAKAKRVK